MLGVSMGFSQNSDVAGAGRHRPFIIVIWWTSKISKLIFPLLSLTGNICLNLAYQTADATWLAPMEFSYLDFSALWSRAIFDR